MAQQPMGGGCSLRLLVACWLISLLCKPPQPNYLAFMQTGWVKQPGGRVVSCAEHWFKSISACVRLALLLAGDVSRDSRRPSQKEPVAQATNMEWSPTTSNTQDTLDRVFQLRQSSIVRGIDMDMKVVGRRKFSEGVILGWMLQFATVHCMILVYPKKSVRTVASRTFPGCRVDQCNNR